jgi:conjugative transfer signal peptidase TraF
MLAAVAVVTSTMGPKPAPCFVWNASESVPIGLYGVQPVGKLMVTSLVVAMPPEPLATFLAEGGYLPRGVPLIKRVLAFPGQSVCRNKLLISVDGTEMGAARERDRRGRPLPVWQGCRRVAEGAVFLMNWDEPASLDGRYFCSIPLSAIVGRAEPLWTYEEEWPCSLFADGALFLGPIRAAPFLRLGPSPIRRRVQRRSRACPWAATRGAAATPPRFRGRQTAASSSPSGRHFKRHRSERPWTL